MTTKFRGPETSLVQNPRRVAARMPDQVAMLFYGQKFTYGQMVHAMDQLASWLVGQADVRPGDRVAVDLQNSPQYVISYYAVLAAGGIVVPLNPMYRQAEIDHILRDSDAKVVITSPDLLPLFLGAEDRKILVAPYRDCLPANIPPGLPSFLSDPVVLAANPQVTLWSEAMAWADPVALPVIEDPATTPAALPYTSGSTGQPKGCLHTHASVMHTAVLQAEWYAFGPDCVVSAVQPLFHVAGMQSTMNGALYAGATMLIMARWDATLAANLFAEHGCTHWIAPPTMVVDMLGRELPNIENAMAQVRCVTGGGSAMPEGVAARLRDSWGLEYIEGYGMTETMSPTHINPMDSPLRGSVGVVVAGTRSLILDPVSLQPLPDGEVGEVAVAGPQIMQGYWNRPEADAETFVTIDGTRFLRTGDLGRRDPEGRFYLVDRLKRMINASGFKVWPSEVERLLSTHCDVAQCCVVAAPDSYRGETVKALIVPRAGTAPEAEAIRHWLRPQLAAYKIPRVIEFRDRLPLTGSQKVDWRALQDEARAATPL